MAGIRTRNRLKALAVEKETTPGTYPDGGGLSLIVTDTGAKKWELRIALEDAGDSSVWVSIQACPLRTLEARPHRSGSGRATGAT